MKRRHNNGGFTLVELMVTIAIGSLITLAGTTTLLLGLRINADSTRTIQQQNTSSMLMEVLQNISESSAVSCKKDVDNNCLITNIDNTHTYLEYKASEDIIYLNGTTFMEDVSSFDATMVNGNQLTVTIKVGEDNTEYSAAVYCRMNPVTTPDPSEPQGG